MEGILHSSIDCNIVGRRTGLRAKNTPCFRAAPQSRNTRVQAIKPQQTVLAAAADSLNVGPDPWNKTYYPKGAHADNSKKPWFIIDAEGQTLGRLAVLAANKIRGKTLPEYSPSMDMGGFVIIINAEKVQVGGAKEDQKIYYRHSGRPGGLKQETFRQLQARIPERIVEKAVKGMLPKGRLGRSLFNHLKVFKGSKHPHQAQRAVDITNIINAKPEQLKEF